MLLSRWCLAAVTLSLLSVWAPQLEAQALSQYRVFRLGADLASVSALAGIGPSEVTTLHTRPALLQEFRSRPSRWLAGPISASTDPVEQITFSFHDGRLYRLVVDYGRGRTEGMTRADMIAAMASVYGPPQAAGGNAAGRPVTPPGTDAGNLLARWSSDGAAMALYRTDAYDAAFRLMLVNPDVDVRARQQAAQAVRMDTEEAPRRELERQQKARDDKAAADTKTRSDNKRLFQP